MILEPGDVNAIRLAEARGRFATEPELTEAGLTAEEYGRRLARLAAGGLIRGWKTTLTVPPLAGGDWVLGAVLIAGERDVGIGNLLAARLPFVTELIVNDCLPGGIGPGLAVLFYSRDFVSESRFISAIPEIGYHEVHQLMSWTFPVRQPLSSEETALARLLLKQPWLDAAGIADALNRDQNWVRAKLDRLLWSRFNSAGIVRVQPELDWSRAENFGHYHFLLDTGHRPDELSRLLGETGFTLVFDGRRFRDRHLQVERDVWGTAGLWDAVAELNSITGVRVAGLMWHRQLLIHNKWAASLIP